MKVALVQTRATACGLSSVYQISVKALFAPAGQTFAARPDMAVLWNRQRGSPSSPPGHREGCILPGRSAGLKDAPVDLVAHG
jgi:hypothetical protein